MKDGDFSLLNGLRPFILVPERFRFTKSPITSSTRAVSKTVSMVFFEIKDQANLSTKDKQISIDKYRFKILTTKRL